MREFQLILLFVLYTNTKIFSVSIIKHVNLLTFSTKRGIDFGLGRAYSANQAARHMLGKRKVDISLKYNVKTFFLGVRQVTFPSGPGK